MDATIHKQILDTVNRVITASGAMGKEAWTLLLKQAYLDAITDIFVCMALLIPCIIVGALASHLHRKSRKIYDDENRENKYYGGGYEWPLPVIILTFIFAILCLVFIGTIIDDAQEIVTGLYNPGYSAFMHIINR